MGKHIIEDNLSDDFEIDGTTVQLKTKVHGYVNSTNQPVVETTDADTFYKAEIKFNALNTLSFLEIDNTVYGLKYIGTENKDVEFYAMVILECDSSGAEVSLQMHKDSTLLKAGAIITFDVKDSMKQMIVIGVDEISQNNHLFLNVGSNTPGAKVTIKGVILKINEL